MNKCSKFHNFCPGGLKRKFNPPSAIDLSKTAVFFTTLNRNRMQGSKFGCPFDQLLLWSFFFCCFHRICLSNPPIPWCKKVKNDQKLKSRGPAKNVENSNVQIHFLKNWAWWPPNTKLFYKYLGFDKKLAHSVRPKPVSSQLNYPNQAFFVCSKNGGGGGGGGGGTVKKHVILLRIHSSKVFSESLSKNESLDTTLVSMETMVSVLKWFIIENLNWEFLFKLKNHVPLVESKRKYLFLKA